MRINVLALSIENLLHHLEVFQIRSGEPDRKLDCFPQLDFRLVGTCFLNNKFYRVLREPRLPLSV